MDFKDLMFENVKISKEDVISELSDLSEMAETDLELTLLDLLSSFVEEDEISQNAYEAIYEVSDAFENDSVSESELNDISDDDLNEAIAAFKKHGFVRCPNGKIRKRGNCGKPLDRKRSRELKKMRKTGKGKQAFKKASIRALKTKRRTGQL